MAYIRTALGTPPTNNTITVLVDDLSYPSTQYETMDMYCYTLSGSYVGMYSMLGLPDAGGNSTDGYRTGTKTFSGLTPGTSYNFYAWSRYGGGDRRIPDSGYYTFSTTGSPPSNTQAPALSVTNVDGDYITLNIQTGDNTGSVELDYDWESGTVNRTVSVGSNQSVNVYFYVPNYDTYYGVRGTAISPDQSQAAVSSWEYFWSGSPPIPVDDITGLSAINYTNNSIEVAWNSATGADWYRVQYKASTSSTWITSTSSTTNTWWTFTGLQPATTYNIRVRGENSETLGNYATINAQTLTNVPTAFNWNSAKISGGTYNLTAQEWNALCSKVNQWREYKQYSNYSFSTAFVGDIFYATMFNQIRTAISPMSPTVSLPASRSSGDVVTATALNGLRDSLNSIPQ